MKRGFSANVPAKKPRTKVGRVLTELTTETVEEQEEAAAQETRSSPRYPLQHASGRVASESPRYREEKDIEERARTAVAAREAVDLERHPPVDREREEESARVRTPIRAFDVPTVVAEAALPHPRHQDSEQSKQPEKSRIIAGRERIEALRERLLEANTARARSTEPGKTAATVRDVIDELRSRLALVTKERADLVASLEGTREELVGVRGDLEKERKVRAGAEELAEERARIAAEAVSEAEVLTEERDQVLAELVEQRKIDEEQLAILSEVEATLNKRDEEMNELRRDTEQLRELLEAREAELGDMRSRIDAELTEKGRLQNQLRKMELEMSGLKEASEALAAIEALVVQRGR